MPTYDYECAKCGQFEQFQKITEEPLTVCPHCGGKVQRKISRNVGIIFKGTGFYITDNRKTDSGSETTGAATNDKKVS